MAKTSFNENAKALIDNIENKKFSKVGLSCRCENCGKKPLWASYINISISLIVFILSAFAIAVLLTLIDDITFSFKLRFQVYVK